MHSPWSSFSRDMCIRNSQTFANWGLSCIQLSQSRMTWAAADASGATKWQALGTELIHISPGQSFGNSDKAVLRADSFVFDIESVAVHLFSHQPRDLVTLAVLPPAARCCSVRLEQKRY